jgi:zinc transport system substrate-binding protein
MWNKVLGVGLLSLLTVSCAKRTADKEEAGLLVSVTIEPQRYFVEKIGGERFRVNVVVPAGQSPETYDPTPQQMAVIQESVAYLQIGYVGFEQVWMSSIHENNLRMPIFDLSEGMTWEESGEGHEGHFHEVDPHIWNSFEGARVIARNTLQALKQIDAAHRAEYEANYTELAEDLWAMEATVAERLRSLCGQGFIIYHPTLTYFAREFNLTQLSIEKDGKEPSPAQMQALVKEAKRLKTRFAFIQQEFDTKNVETVAKATGCRTMTIYPLAYDTPAELLRIARILANERVD